jgi:hypothetical protein
MQGYYEGNSLMRSVLVNQGLVANSNMVDTITVTLHDALPPYAPVVSTSTMLYTNGFVNCVFPPVTGSYYVSIRQRNSLVTWSSNPIVFSGATVFYDFSLSSAQAYGNNMIEVDPGVWAIYTGDLNADENIDLLDASLLETSISNFEFGYVSPDLNGDGNVDLLDSPALETNANNFIFAIYPQ